MAILPTTNLFPSSSEACPSLLFGTRDRSDSYAIVHFVRGVHHHKSASATTSDSSSTAEPTATSTGHDTAHL